ncbi:hypothetical protein E3N88_09843 [Mikania micrantha]|uniref:Uncharacterized protein n=1 Tax=Mikania micrantha TaxID=192012 RepID=A0A5N6PL52_9ASTR|nr:hypothetical protein E3N88_09843 [Mikania micrantha]
MYGIELGDKVCQLCEEELVNIFNEYKRIHLDNNTTKASSSSSKPVNEETSIGKNFNLFGSVDDTFRALRERNMAEVKRQKIESGVTEDSKTELDRYLNEEIEGDNVWFESQDFTVLDEKGINRVKEEKRCNKDHGHELLARERKCLRLNVATSPTGSHDADTEFAMAAVISLGLIGAGTNNARIAGVNTFNTPGVEENCHYLKNFLFMSKSEDADMKLIDFGLSDFI